MGLALRKDEFSNEIKKISHLPLPKNIREIFDKYEASYYDFVVSLTKENSDITEASIKMLKFKIYRREFYSKLIKFSQSGKFSTYLEGNEHFMETLKSSRYTLLETFPDHFNVLQRGIETPVAYLPFIKINEDPFTDIYGQTMKFNEAESFISVRTGTGKEFSTTMHEFLHATVRDLPGFFEEGFCRYSLQSRLFEPNEIPLMVQSDPQTLRFNFSGIYYPNLLVNMLSEAVGGKQVEDVFFTQETDELDAFLRRIAGEGFASLDRPFKDGRNADALDIIEKMSKCLGYGLSSNLSAVIAKVLEIASAPIHITSEK